jgi:hypothetical protein
MRPAQGFSDTELGLASQVISLLDVLSLLRCLYRSLCRLALNKRQELIMTGSMFVGSTLQKVAAYANQQGLSPLITSAIIAWMNTLAQGFQKDAGWGTPGIVEFVYGFFLWLVVYAFLLIILYVIDRINVTNTKSDIDTEAVEETESALAIFGIRKRATLKSTITFMLCWLPITIALFPGVPFHDTLFQLAQYFGNPAYGNFSSQLGADYTDHHPIFTTFVFGFIIDIGKSLTGSSTFGMFLLTALQAFLTAYTFACSAIYLESLGTDTRVVRLVKIIYAVFPLISISVNCIAKETFFGWIYLWYLMFIVEYIRTRGSFFKNKRVAFTHLIICMLLALTKKTGVYLVFITGLIIIIVYRKTSLVWLASVMLPLVTVMWFMPSVIFPLLNVSPGSQTEVFGVLYQQTARYVIEYPDEVTADEMQIIDELIGYGTIADRYQPDSADSLKGCGFLEGVESWPSSNQINRYLRCYVSQGLRHPDAYFHAFGALNSGWFANNSYGEGYATIFNWLTYSATEASFWPENVPHYYRPLLITYFAEGFSRLCAMIAKTPVLSIVFTPAFYVLNTPLVCLMLVIKNDKRNRGVFIPIFTSLLFLLVSPVTGTTREAFRYAIPFIYSTPFIIGIALLRPSSKSVNIAL